MISSGILFVVSGPSGVGKSTILQEILSRENGNMVFSVSCTTRTKRAGEIDGKDYFFLTEPEFLKKIENKEFIEWAKVHNNYYGTLKSWVENVLSEGKDVVLDIDVQGAENLKKILNYGNFIFIAPPSIDELEKRIRGRHTDSEESIQIRLANAKKELDKIYLYDYVVKNELLETAILNFQKIIILERTKKN